MLREARGACRTRAGRVSANAAFALMLEAGGLLFEDRVDPGVRRVGDEMQAIVFGLDQFLTDFGSRFFLGKRVGGGACDRKEGHLECN